MRGHASACAQAPGSCSIALAALGLEHVGPAYVGWLNDPAVMRYTEARFREHTLEDVRAYVVQTNSSPTDRIWRILANDRHVGNVKLSGISERHRRASLSILIGDRSSWGQGIAPVAIRLATDLSFLGHPVLHKIHAGIYAPNVASIRAFEKAGYVLEATLREHRCLDGQMVDEVLMACFRSSTR